MRAAPGATMLLALACSMALASAANPAPTPGTWQALGPVQGIGNPGDQSHSGRITCIAFAYDTPVSPVVYAGAASGGLWKSDASTAASWRPLTDTLPTLSVGSVAAATSGPYTVYVGTGDARGARNSFAGRGVFRSRDLGITWSATSPLDPIRAPHNRTAIPAIVVDLFDPDTVYAAVKSFNEDNLDIDGGIYRSADGGASWSRVLGGGLPAGAVTPTSLVADETDPLTFYAALGDSNGSPNNGFWRSADHGATFVKLGGGFPTANVGRIILAKVAGVGQALLAGVENSATQGLLGIWRTADGGASWQQLPASGATCTRCKQEMILGVSPANPNVIFFGAEAMYRSMDNGQFFIKINSGLNQLLHGDEHAIAFNPLAPSQLWIGSDGGMQFLDDALGPAPVLWQSNDQGMNITQFYGVAVHPTNPDVAFAGSQDNGFFKYSGSTAWTLVGGGDAGAPILNYQDPNVVYWTLGFGTGPQRSLDGGATWGGAAAGLDFHDRSLFYPPFEIDPRDPSVLYFASYRLYRTADRGDLWQPISGDLTVDPADPNNLGVLSAMGAGGPDMNVIYTGSTNGQIYVTSNLGAAWVHADSPPIPHRKVSSFAVHPADSSVAYVTYTGFDTATEHGHVFRTSNRGLSWTDVSGNLPDLPVNHIVFDLSLPNIVYVGTDAGVFVSTIGGGTWRQLGTGLPNAPVVRLAARASNLITATAHGRGAWQIHGCAGGGVPDADGDNVADACDNCPSVANGPQTDADLDGYGAACDCNDADPAISPGSPEVVCDGVDNNCDGSVDEGQAPPDEVGATVAAGAGGSFTWTAPPRAIAYDLYRGDRAGKSPFTYDHACLSSGIPAASATDTAAPALGRAFYYLVASRNCMGVSGLGSGPAGPRPNVSPCP
ncbi:MAG: hypothetical protein HY049_13250 [Acidobacteria bacterium]|nr:hypothetical protein [Acidobacteriota bacterium]